MYECHAKSHLLYLWPDERDHDDVPEVGVQPEGPGQERGGEHPHLERQSHRPEAGELPGEPHRGHQIEHPHLLHLRELEARGMWRVVGPGCLQASRARWGALPPEGAASCGAVTVVRGDGFECVIVVKLSIFINKIFVKALLFFFWTDTKSHGDRVTTTTVNHGSGSLK